MKNVTVVIITKCLLDNKDHPHEPGGQSHGGCNETGSKMTLHPLFHLLSSPMSNTTVSQCTAILHGPLIGSGFSPNKNRQLCE